MKHLLLICAALSALATTLPAGELAMARDQDRGGHQGGRERGPERRGPEQRGPEQRGDRRGDDRRGDDRRGDDRRWNDGRGEAPDRGRRSLRQEDERRYDGGRRDEDGYPPRNARRGGYLPDSYRGGVVDDYQRFRLRPPPRGYTWVRVNGGYALVSVADGRVFDVIPD